ncbi:MAG: integrase family protein [Kofleriaceae bacterium]|nr:integrase family protein [Kofleriaceae bacterium]
MPIKLTEKTLKTLRCPPGKARVYAYDAELKGFGVDIKPSGTMTFIARTRDRMHTIGVAGQPRPDGHIWTVELARREAYGLLGKLKSGEVPPPRSRAAGPTLQQGLELHLRNMREGRNRRRRPCSERSIQKIETEVPRHLEAWLDRPIVELTADELEKVCDRIRANTPAMAGAVNPPGVAQANKVIAHVSAIWNALDKRYDLPGKNPAKRLSLSALKPRETRIDDGAFADWYERVLAIDPVRRDLQLVSLFTAIRTDGVRNLRWEDIDEERGLLHVRKAKGDKPYTLPLVETVRKILEKRRTENAETFKAWKGDGGWIFPSITRDGLRVQPVAEPKERRTVEDEDGEKVRVQHLPGIHANRRTFNSVAIEIGVPPEARLALMNHEGKGVNVKHYGAPQNWEYLREQAERVEAALWERLTPKPTTKPRGKLRAV